MSLSLNWVCYFNIILYVVLLFKFVSVFKIPPECYQPLMVVVASSADGNKGDRHFETW